MRLSIGAVLAWGALLSLSVGCNQEEKHDSLFSKVMTKDTVEGTGPSAAEGDLVLVQYVGKFAKSGQMFDTNDPDKSEKNKIPLGAVLGPNAGIVPGLVTGLEGMKVGGERTISIPWQQAYGPMGNEMIPAYSDLVFDVKMLYIVKKGDENTVDVEDETVGSGVEAKDGDTVTVNYTGSFVNGRMFDDRMAPDKAVKFTIGSQEAITAFERGVLGMKVGGKRKLTIPPMAGWGPTGHDVIPGGQVTIYDVTLVDCKPSKS